MTDPVVNVEKIELQGFRAYLEPQTLDLASGKTKLSMAIFGPNAKGKSSLVDAFEYYFSVDGTLERLGLVSAQTNAGPLAMKHVAADAKGIQSLVHLWFRQGNDRFDAQRPLGDSMPCAAERVLSNTKVPFVIRGYELRRFVEETSPNAQYKELTRWFGLDPLLRIQHNLRASRRGVKEKAESTYEVDQKHRELSLMTAGKVATWDDQALCVWFNGEVLDQLDGSLRFKEMSEQDPAFAILVARWEVEQGQLGLTQLRRVSQFLSELISPVSNCDGEPAGKIPTFENAVSELEHAVARESEERSKASSAVFNQVWDCAKTLFESDVAFDTCPVCEADLSQGPHGTRGGILISLNTKLADLDKYRKAVKELKRVRIQAGKTVEGLKTSLKSTARELDDSGYGCSEMTSYLQELLIWSEGEEVPVSGEAVRAISELQDTIDDRVSRIEEQQGDNTYTKALDTVKGLFDLKEDLDRILRTKKELRLLNDQLDRQAHEFDRSIVGHIQNLVGELQTEVSTIYEEIQGSGSNAPPIRIELARPGYMDQARAQLLIDFSENRLGVLPSGYLSDSQVHTLALALRLSAVKMFNTRVPIVVLDDVVTSYDADHRKTIARALSKYFSEFQVLLVTHDEQFFNLLKDHLPQGSWRFKRITEVRDGFGPVFHDHQTSDELIQEKLDAGARAGDEIRQVEEEWLLRVCRDFRTSVAIRPIERAFQYERSELADSLAGFLRRAKIQPPQVPGISNPFLASLQKGAVENLASHFPDNPYTSISAGDERARWEEFRYFRDLFKCNSCGHARFLRPWQLDRPVCSKCQTPFEFVIPNSE